MHRSILSKILLAAIICGIAGLTAFAPTTTQAADDLEQRFQNPNDADKPWAYWWWLNGNVDKATMTNDLEQMKAKGFGGLLLFDARGYHDDDAHVPAPKPRMEFMSEECRGQCLKGG